MTNALPALRALADLVDVLGGALGSYIHSGLSTIDIGPMFQETELAPHTACRAVLQIGMPRNTFHRHETHTNTHQAVGCAT